MGTPLRALLLLLAVLLAVTSCTTLDEGSPSATPTGEEQTSASMPPGTDEPDDREVPYAGAPAVENPLDTTRYQGNPCLAITAAQAEALNLNATGESYEGGLGNACHFDGRTDLRAGVDIASLDEYPFGLSAIYQANEDGKYEFFEVLPPIEGYPAVARAASDDRQNGGCAVEIGTSDEITFEVAVLLAQEFVGVKDPCESAVLVAGEVIRTMKATP